MTRKITRRELSDKIALSVINGEKTEKEWSEELGEKEYPVRRIHQWVVAYIRKHDLDYKIAGKTTYIKEFKDEVCAKHIEEGVPIEKLCRQYSISMFTMKRWINRYLEEKEAGTLGDYKFTREFTEWHEKDREEIIRYCMENDKTPSEAADYFHRNYYQVRTIVTNYKHFLKQTEKGEYEPKPRYIKKILNYYYSHGEDIYATAEGANSKYYVVQWVVDHYGDDPRHRQNS